MSGEVKNRGFSGARRIFGEAGEFYTASLFQMVKNPNGDRRPDLSSFDGRYDPHWLLEVKSGLAMKGVISDYQLHYAITTSAVYRELFRQDPPERRISTELFPDQPLLQEGILAPGEAVPYYYCVLDRVDDLTCEAVKSFRDSVRCKWGDLFIAPAEFAFYSFVIFRAGRDKVDPEELIPKTMAKMQKDAAEWNPQDYAQTKGHAYSWQNIEGRDILAVFEGKDSIATDDGQKRRIPFYRKHMKMDTWERIKIPGPNGTTLYILAKPEDNQLFEVQARRTVAERIPVLEKITKERADAIPLLAKKVFYSGTRNLFGDEGETTQEEESLIERLGYWLDEGEELPVPISEAVPF